MENDREVIIQYFDDAFITIESLLGFFVDETKTGYVFDMRRVEVMDVVGNACMIRTEMLKVIKVREYHDQVILDVCPTAKKVSRADIEYNERLLAWYEYLRTGEFVE